jgi:serine/threonine protein kinase
MNYMNLETVLFRHDLRITRDERLLLDFVQKCLIFDPTSRMTCEEALNHPWLSDSQDEENIKIGAHIQNGQSVVHPFSPSNLNQNFEKSKK